MSFAVGHNRPLMVRTGACMAGVSALLASVQLLAMRFPPGALVPAVVVAGLGLMLARHGERLPTSTPALLCVALLALGTYTVSETGSSNGALLAYILPVVWAGFFFDRPHMILMVCGGAAADALALAGSGVDAGRAVAWVEVVASLCAVAVLTYTLVDSYRRTLAAREIEARIDPLTELLNRRGLLERAEIELARARREHEAVSVIAFDIDHFKKINDAHGHDFGDQVLMHFADVLRSQVRTIDVVARTGGEEFVLLLPACGLDDARIVADRVRNEFADRPLDGHTPGTVSAGVSSLERPLELSPMLLAADRALYAAKAAGRDCTRAEVQLECELPQLAMVAA